MYKNGCSECILIIINDCTYLNVPPFASSSKPSSGSAEQFPDFEDANFMPSFAKFPTYFTVTKMCVYYYTNIKKEHVKEENPPKAAGKAHTKINELI